ncbi:MULTISPECIES: type I restriction endonuclease [Corynebacterium]|uniref:type I restriction endonuclease n=1 Tax=Corynebacterium sp. CNCTC7651 TaxID=2815361 RepID=UPI001EECBB38|nr:MULTISPECIES: type I restriction endonuclease [Corynebacterium]
MSAQEYSTFRRREFSPITSSISGPCGSRAAEAENATHTYDPNGKRQNPTITFFSGDASKNDYIVANQITIRNLDKERRFDVVLYVNGMPLGIIELKQSGSTATVENAFNQLRTYVEEFPMAFRFANFVVASDGIDAIYGTSFTPREHMSTWRVDDDGEPFEQAPLVVVDGEQMTEFDMLMWGLFNVERFGQIFVDFTAFDEMDGELRMRVAKPHQYFAVTIEHSVLAPRRNAGSPSRRPDRAERYRWADRRGGSSRDLGKVDFSTSRNQPIRRSHQPACHYRLSA